MAESDPQRKPEWFPVQSAAAAPALEFFPTQQTQPSVEERKAPVGPQLVTELPTSVDKSEYLHQGSLFGPQPTPKRVPGSPRPTASAPKNPKPPRPKVTQEAFSFDLIETRRENATVGEAALSYKAPPIAETAHRMIAAALDMAVILMAIAAFSIAAMLGGLDLAFTKASSPFYLAAVVLIVVFYRMLFCIGNIDSLGMQWTGLRLVNFDAHPPTRSQRMQRTFAGFLSVISIGMGLLWAMFDEEHLTWHDYISKTFPSPKMM